MQLALAAAMTLPAFAANAGPLLSAPEFERMSTGKTLFFSLAGKAYGAERYLPGRRVIWQYLDGSCDQGYWYAEGPALCFVYESNPMPQCWVIESREGDFFVRTAELPPGDPSELRLVGESEAPLACAAPGLGV